MSKSGGQRSQIKSGRAGAPIVKAGGKATGSNPVKGIPINDHTSRQQIIERLERSRERRAAQKERRKQDELEQRDGKKG